MRTLWWTPAAWPARHTRSVAELLSPATPRHRLTHTIKGELYTKVARPRPVRPGFTLRFEPPLCMGVEVSRQVQSNRPI